MKYIEEAMLKIDENNLERPEHDISLVERILRKTQNPKIAAVLALDLLLVGIDTVSFRFFSIVSIVFIQNS